MYPITAYVPKSLIPVAGRYVIEHAIDYLKRFDVTELVMLVSQNEYELFQNHLGNGERYGVNVEYSVAERLGTAGAVGAAASLLRDTFIVYYGDVLTDMNLREMIDFHSAKESFCTIALSTSVPIEYGVAKVSDDGRVTYFAEKPVLKEYPVSMGIDIFEEEALTYCRPHTDIAQDIIPRLLQDHKPVFAYLTEHRHYDIGTFKSLEEINRMLEQKKTNTHSDA